MGCRPCEKKRWGFVIFKLSQLVLVAVWIRIKIVYFCFQINKCCVWLGVDVMARWYCCCCCCFYRQYWCCWWCSYCCLIFSEQVSNDALSKKNFAQTTSPNFSTGLIPVIINYVGRGWFCVGWLKFSALLRSLLSQFYRTISLLDRQPKTKMRSACTNCFYVFVGPFFTFSNWYYDNIWLCTIFVNFAYVIFLCFFMR